MEKTNQIKNNLYLLSACPKSRKHLYFRDITKNFILAFRNGFAPVKIFNAIARSVTTPSLCSEQAPQSPEISTYPLDVCIGTGGIASLRSQQYNIAV